MLGERKESERAFSGSCQRLQGIARRRSIPSSGLRDSRRWTETGRKGGKDDLLIWQQTQSATASEREQQEQREQTRGARGKRGCNPNYCHVEPPRRVFTASSCASPPPAVCYRSTSATLCRRAPLLARWAVAQALLLGQHPLFFFFPDDFVELRSFLSPNEDHLLPRSCDAISKASPSAPLCILSSESD